MKKVAYFCDRCGRETNPNNLNNIAISIRRKLTPLYTSGFRANGYTDICNSCVRAIRKDLNALGLAIEVDIGEKEI